jgi:very-short-patch-repair endonuclease
VLACGQGAIVSHRSAAALWCLSGSDSGDVDITVCGRCCRSRPGIRIHRVLRLDARDVRTLHGIPLTAPARTLIDYAESARGSQLENAVEDALRRRLVRRRELLDLLERYPGRPGAPALRSVLELDGGPALTRSEAEARLLSLVRAARLPIPEANVAVGRYEVDFLWRAERVIVEVDGYAFHSSRAAFERDRRRSADLQAAGFHVLRLTWRQIVEEREALVAQIAFALTASSVRQGG